MRRASAALLVALFGLLAHAGEAARLLDEAQRSERQYHFAEGLSAARKGLSAGDAEPETTWRLHAVIGEIAAAMGEPELAIASFSRALELHPSLDIPADSSPKLWVPFQKALRQNHGVALRLLPRTERVGTLLRLRLQVDGDALHLVETARVYVQEGAHFAPHPLTKTDLFVGTAACGTERCNHYVEVADGAGNVLARAGTPDAPLTALVPPSKPPWLARRWPFFLGAGAVAAAGAVFAVQAVRQDAQLAQMKANAGAYLYRQAKDAQALRNRDEALAFTGGGLTLAVLAVGVFW